VKVRLLCLALGLALSAGGCSRFNEAVTLKVVGGDGDALAAYVEPEVDPEPAESGGTEPGRALRAAEADSARWRLRSPTALSSLPARVAPDRGGTGVPGSVTPDRARDGAAADARLRDIDRAGGHGLGSVCRGC
jgi:hypothetical protein